MTPKKKIEIQVNSYFYLVKKKGPLSKDTRPKHK